MINTPGYANRNPYAAGGSYFARGSAGGGISNAGRVGNGFGGYASSGGGYAGAGGTLGSEFWNARNSANKANEQRYQDILGGYKGLRSRNNERVANLGVQERRDIAERFQGQLSQQQAGMRRRGLGGTSLASGAAMSSRRRESDAQGGLNERLLRTAIGQDSADTERIGVVMERKTDSSPDLGMLGSLAQMQGQGGGGGLAGAPIFAGGGYGFGGGGSYGYGGINPHLQQFGAYGGGARSGTFRGTQAAPGTYSGGAYTGGYSSGSSGGGRGYDVLGSAGGGGGYVSNASGTPSWANPTGTRLGANDPNQGFFPYSMTSKYR